MRRSRLRQVRGCVFGRGAQHDVGDAAVDQKLRLAGVAEQLQPGFLAGTRHGAEIDMAGDVLQAGQEKRIGMRAVAVVAHQRALGALRMVVLMRRKTVIDEQDHAARHRLRQCAHESAGYQLYFGLVPGRQPQRLGRRAQLRGRRPPSPGKGAALQYDPGLFHAGGAGPDQVRRHCVQHLVADDQALIERRQPVEPDHALEQLRHLQREQVALALAQVGADFEDVIIARQPVQALQFGQQGCRERARAGADFQDLVQARFEHLGRLARQRLAV